MMKATTLKRGSRKKQVPSGPPQKDERPMAPPPPPPQQLQQQQMMMMMQHVQQQQQQPRPHPPPPPPPQMHPDQVVRRAQSVRAGPAPEHLELTKKNYRLAKELSELRVRHREECKNVTRLTMENMNLASRCREAITHVAMLKKELAMHQKRAQEALRFQREQTQRMASNLTADLSRLSQSFESGSNNSTPDRKIEMERLLSNMTPPPPPPPRTTPSVAVAAAADPPEQKSSQRDDLTTDAVVSSDEDDTVDETLRGRSVLDVVESLSESPEKTQPRVYSTPNRNRKEDRWTPHIDAAPGEHERDPEGMSLFVHSPSLKVGGSTMRRQKYNEEFPSDIVPQPGTTATRSHSSQKPVTEEVDDDDDDDDFGIPTPTKMGILDRHSGMITMNSIDAFEASFETTFPSTFSQSRSSKDSTTKEIYNPFAPSPARSVGRSAPPTPPHSQASEIEVSPEVIRITNSSNRSPFTTPTSYNADRTDNNRRQYETPPKDRPTSDGTPYGEPSRPHKTASAEARARYQKALQPRGSNANGSQSPSTTPHRIPPDDEVEVPKTSGFMMPSPSSLLKRIQERRKHKEPAGSSDPSLMQENFEPYSEEMHEQYQGPGTPEHHSMAATTLGASKSRRSVKQPISYAEPALNTKIRQGHSYFPKSNEPRIVTPEQVTHAS